MLQPASYVSRMTTGTAMRRFPHLIPRFVRSLVLPSGRRGKERVFDIISYGNCSKLAELLGKERHICSLTDSHGGTPLHRAALEARADMVKVLLDYDGTCTARESTFGFTPLHMLACRGYAPLVTAMHPKINVSRLCGVERCEEEIEIAGLLIEYGADINSGAGFNRTALHLAILSQKPELTRWLLANGADMSPTDDLGFSPLHYAAFRDSVECAQVLTGPSNDIDIKAQMGYTPLHIAAEKGNEHVAALFKSSGADLSVRTEHNMTPADLAGQRGHLDLAETIDSGNKEQ